MDKVRKVVDSIIDELDGRKGFDFYDFDTEILDEIKDELVKLILPVVGLQSEQLRFLIDKFQTPKGNYIIDLLMEHKDSKEKP